MTDRRDHGFTLIELIIAVALLGIIASAAAMLFTVTVRTTEQTSERYRDSRGPRTLSAYWVPDVASAERVNLNSGPCGGGAPIVTFSWTDDRPALGVVTTSWFLSSGGSALQLIRQKCINGDLSTPVTRNVVAPRVATDGAKVTCDDGAPCVEDGQPRSVAIEVTTPGGYRYALDGSLQVRSTQP